MFINTKKPVKLLYTLILGEEGKIIQKSLPNDLERDYKIIAKHGGYHYTVSATITSNDITIGLVILDEET